MEITGSPFKMPAMGGEGAGNPLSELPSWGSCYWRAAGWEQLTSRSQGQAQCGRFAGSAGVECASTEISERGLVWMGWHLRITVRIQMASWWLCSSSVGCGVGEASLKPALWPAGEHCIKWAVCWTQNWESRILVLAPPQTTTEAPCSSKYIAVGDADVINNIWIRTSYCFVCSTQTSLTKIKKEIWSLRISEVFFH